MTPWYLNPKNILIAVLAVVIVGLTATYFVQRGLISAKNGRIEEQNQQIQVLDRENEKLNNNAEAARVAEKQMQDLIKRATSVREMIESIPDEVKKGMKNETMERVNHCLGAYFRDGVLPKDCDQAGGTVLPQTPGAGLEGRR